MTLQIHTVKQLLNLYYGGLASTDDERRLVEFFTTETDIPCELQDDRDVVLSLARLGEVRIPDGMADELSALAERLDRQERISRRGHRWVAATSVAASIAIIVSVIVFIARSSSTDPYEITDPQLAETEAHKALLLVSEALDNSDGSIIEAGRALSLFVPYDSISNNTIHTEDDETI